MKIDEVRVRQVRLPLATPYKVSLLTMREFDPFLVEVRDDGGRFGVGEALIVPGYTTETVEGSWERCCAMARRIAGRDPEQAKAIARSEVQSGAGAASAVLAALDMLTGHPALAPVQDLAIPLLAPLHGEQRAALAEEIERNLAHGYRTLKVKVGFDWRHDLRHVETIQQLTAGRASLRLDANQGFSAADGQAFAARLDPTGIELFEQPCAMDDWDANQAVAAVSTVPLMLDESIYDVTDIDRAATIDGVGFVKLKLKKIGSIDMLEAALARIRAFGLTPVLGDGVSLEIGCWMEACVAARCISNAGEMNGFLKTTQRLFADPLQFAAGAIRIPAGYTPQVDHDLLARSTVRQLAFDARVLAA